MERGEELAGRLQTIRERMARASEGRYPLPKVLAVTKTHTPEEILPLLTENPARLIGEDHKRGYIREGYRADFVVLDPENRVVSTYVGGRKVF